MSKRSDGKRYNPRRALKALRREIRFKMQDGSANEIDYIDIVVINELLDYLNKFNHLYDKKLEYGNGKNKKDNG